MPLSTTHPLLKELDTYRERINEGLLGVMGDHGAHIKDIERFTEALGDALWAAQDAAALIAQGDEVGRKARGQAKRQESLERTIDALIILSNVRR